MISDSLFKKVLLEPANHGADTLFIVSGYATAAMAFHHVEYLKKNYKKSINVNIIVGMCLNDGLSLSNHSAFKNLSNSDLKGRLNCRYIVKKPQVHSKVYAWFEGKKPCEGFVGSANYTQNAFCSSQREVLTNCDPLLAYEYFRNLIPSTLDCSEKSIPKLFSIYDDPSKMGINSNTKAQKEISKSSEDGFTMKKNFITVSFLDKNGDLPMRSGLNWGQRPEVKREPNQAYIRLPSEIYTTDFFPPVASHFTILTDDNKIFICARAQQNGKAIHTPHNNSLLGEYLRKRLGVRLGNPVTKLDLLRYGRTDVTFYKIDDENYLMDFSNLKK